MALFPVRSNPRWQPAAILENYNGISRFPCDSTAFLFYCCITNKSLILSLTVDISLLGAIHWISLYMSKGFLLHRRSEIFHETPID